MARPEKPKTPFAARLVDVRKARGFEKREPFADHLGMPLETLAGYERGTREMPLAWLEAYRSRFNVNLNWLIHGDGEMFEAPSPVNGRAAQLLADFQKLPEDRQLDILDFVTINLKRAGR